MSSSRHFLADISRRILLSRHRRRRSLRNSWTVAAVDTLERRLNLSASPLVDAAFEWGPDSFFGDETVPELSPEAMPFADFSMPVDGVFEFGNPDEFLIPDEFTATVFDPHAWHADWHFPMIPHEAFLPEFVENDALSSSLGELSDDPFSVEFPFENNELAVLEEELAEPVDSFVDSDIPDEYDFSDADAWSPETSDFFDDGMPVDSEFSEPFDDEYWQAWDVAMASVDPEFVDFAFEPEDLDWADPWMPVVDVFEFEEPDVDIYDVEGEWILPEDWYAEFSGEFFEESFLAPVPTDWPDDAFGIDGLYEDDAFAAWDETVPEQFEDAEFFDDPAFEDGDYFHTEFSDVVFDIPPEDEANFTSGQPEIVDQDSIFDWLEDPFVFGTSDTIDEFPESELSDLFIFDDVPDSENYLNDESEADSAPTTLVEEIATVFVSELPDISDFTETETLLTATDTTPDVFEQNASDFGLSDDLENSTSTTAEIALPESVTPETTTTPNTDSAAVSSDSAADTTPSPSTAIDPDRLPAKADTSVATEAQQVQSLAGKDGDLSNVRTVVSNATQEFLQTSRLSDVRIPEMKSADNPDRPATVRSDSTEATHRLITENGTVIASGNSAQTTNAGDDAVAAVLRQLSLPVLSSGLTVSDLEMSVRYMPNFAQSSLNLMAVETVSSGEFFGSPVSGTDRIRAASTFSGPFWLVLTVAAGVSARSFSIVRRRQAYADLQSRPV